MATVNTVPDVSQGDDGRAVPTCSVADPRRRRVREFLAVQEQRWARAESELLKHLNCLAAALDGNSEASAVAPRQSDAVRPSKPGPAPAPAATSGGVLNWEAEKRRIIAALESEVETDDDTAAAERLKLNEVIATTDRVVADKEREVAELQHLLANQSSSLGSVAVGAAAIGELIDQDAIIREERKSLKRLQEEWRDKLRRAEIEISLERAQIARQKVEIDEKRREVERQMGAPGGPLDHGSLTSKPVRGRWLARLGLKELDES
jgi:hypothetical protein